jgi:hypothetical protein
MSTHSAGHIQLNVINAIAFSSHHKLINTWKVSDCIMCCQAFGFILHIVAANAQLHPVRNGGYLFFFNLLP